MSDKICYTEDPPYSWRAAYKITSKEYKIHHKEVHKKVVETLMFHTENDVKAIQFASLSLGVVCKMGIYRGMTWLFFKNHLMEIIKNKIYEIPFEYEDIQDITITFENGEYTKAIDESKDDVYTMIPDNVVIFLSQIKVNDIWYFIK
jgi:hypothetical protein